MATCPLKKKHYNRLYIVFECIPLFKDVDHHIKVILCGWCSLIRSRVSSTTLKS